MKLIDLRQKVSERLDILREQRLKLNNIINNDNTSPLQNNVCANSQRKYQRKTGDFPQIQNTYVIY